MSNNKNNHLVTSPLHFKPRCEIFDVSTHCSGRLNGSICKDIGGWANLAVECSAHQTTKICIQSMSKVKSRLVSIAISVIVQ